jgi:hypothetical protein
VDLQEGHADLQHPEWACGFGTNHLGYAWNFRAGHLPTGVRPSFCRRYVQNDLFIYLFIYSFLCMQNGGRRRCLWLMNTYSVQERCISNTKKKKNLAILYGTCNWRTMKKHFVNFCYWLKKPFFMGCYLTLCFYFKNYVFRRLGNKLNIHHNINLTLCCLNFHLGFDSMLTTILRLECKKNLDSININLTLVTIIAFNRASFTCNV